MSGGSWNYAHQRVNEIVDEISQLDMENKHTSNLRQKLYVHMNELSELMRLIELCDSGDLEANLWINPAKRFLKIEDDHY